MVRGKIIFLFACFYHSQSWTTPEQGLRTQPHYYDVAIQARISRLFLESSHAKMIEILHLVEGMFIAPVFDPVDNASQYQHLGSLWNYLFKAEATEINKTIHYILHDLTYLIDSNPLLRKESFLSKSQNFHCQIEVGIEHQMLQRFYELVSYLASNWLTPRTPDLIGSFNGQDEALFLQIIANR